MGVQLVAMLVPFFARPYCVDHSNPERVDGGGCVCALKNLSIIKGGVFLSEQTRGRVLVPGRVKSSDKGSLAPKESAKRVASFTLDSERVSPQSLPIT